MKLLIQIPCYNEAETLPVLLSELPRSVPGFETVEWLVIDDGSNDQTVSVAKNHGVNHILSHPKNLGLARAYMSGLEECLKLGADVIVNTDADNQYNSEDISLLVKPILEQNAEIVVGERPIIDIQHFSLTKKVLQRLGSWIVRMVSGTDIPDAPSGFRAISRVAAQKTNVLSNYTYTLETIIQAGQKNMKIVSIPIRVNRELRPSRLVKSTSNYVISSIVTIVRIFVVYRPFRFFVTISIFFSVVGISLAFRFLVSYFHGNGQGNVQSLILGSAFLVMGFQTLMVAFISDLLAANRRLIEDIRFKISNMESTKNINGTI
jgi:glycosyltransferase involved in cell wall biosynthesis